MSIIMPAGPCRRGSGLSPIRWQRVIFILVIFILVIFILVIFILVIFTIVIFTAPALQ